MSDVLYNLLYSLGIHADVQVLPGTAFPREYERIEEGISELRRALGLKTQEHDGAIMAYLERRGTAGGAEGDTGGRYCLCNDLMEDR